MKVLVTGVTGQLGYDCVRELEKRGIEVRGVSSRDFSLTDPVGMQNYMEAYRPDAVIHCAAYTAVDKAEDEPEICEAINAEGTRQLAMICRDLDCKMLYISTDYVFPGVGEAYYEPDDIKDPCNAYGRSKLHGEEAVLELLEKYFIVRISWVFGINGKNFIRTMLKLAETHKELTVVNDQIGSPTYTRDLAVLLADMVQSDKYGMYHATNEGVCSWAELAAETFRQAGKDVKVTPVPSSAYPTKAVRPKNSRLSKDCLEKAGFKRLPKWQDAVKRYLKEIKEN
ncbi:dTDP-4-dehydrorhamnose reductase [Selenomonas ruminis]|uniref:dTDP-4-dehydrorhamnose reductase n=1 Tax=Selenomonas ruminis TaxID=2593411 RepID=A0A5D6W7E8_9FIRM|nr:dTDP-4-dehydrorhamnose reductase [Selenomonas sp. mPRGC5]TYZ23917.1 dTDP-4-dehydrorhamnose reductase [Selenomonas sp. mPRGC5]